MLLEGKNILIMGIRNKWSIAYGAAKSAYEQGANLLYTYHPTENDGKIKELMSEFENVKAYPCDVGTDQEIEDLFTQIQRDYGHLDGILHSIAHANTEDLRGEFIQTSRAGYNHANEVSGYSFIAICRAARKVLTENASLVTLTYYGAEKVLPGYNVMGVAKAGLEANVRYLAYELGKEKIRVNAISAGPIKTLSAKGIKDFNDMLSIAQEKAPMKENVTIEQVGDAVTFLFSKMSSGITGQVIYVDNGYCIMGL